ncbi:hypothetical protein D3C85_1683040 [compost metagenome]
MKSCDKASMGTLTARKVLISEISSRIEPHCSIRIGPMLSMSWPAGMAMTMGNRALSVTMKPISSVEAPISAA